MKTTAGTLLLALTLAACGASDDADPVASPSSPTVAAPTTTEAPAPTTPTSELGNWPTEPPPVVFESNGELVEVDAFTVCWTEPPVDDPDEETESWCADGMPEPATSPVVMPAGGEIRFTFDVTGWRFSAAYLDSAGQLAVTQIDDTTWSLAAPTKTSDDLVVVSGFGPQGDVHVGIALPESEPRSSVPAEELIGETFDVDIVDRCADGISVGIGDELFLIEGELTGITEPAGREWLRTDFPDDWEVEVLNDKPVDGDGWVIRGAEALRVDEVTIEVSDPATGEPIGTFLLDQRSPAERFFCG